MLGTLRVLWYTFANVKSMGTALILSMLSAFLFYTGHPILASVPLAIMLGIVLFVAMFFSWAFGTYSKAEQEKATTATVKKTA